MVNNMQKYIPYKNDMFVFPFFKVLTNGDPERNTNICRSNDNMSG